MKTSLTVLLLILIALPGPALAESPPEENQTPPGVTMTDEEFEEYAESAGAELTEKQERLITHHGLGTFARWNLDQPTETLEFFDERGERALKASAIIIGTYAPTSQTWQWAWANDSISANLRKQAEPLKELGAVTGLPVFTREAFQLGDQRMIEDLVAMCVRHLGALGIYKAPSSSGGPTIFLAITEIDTAAE